MMKLKLIIIIFTISNVLFSQSQSDSLSTVWKNTELDIEARSKALFLHGSLCLTNNTNIDSAEYLLKEGREMFKGTLSTHATFYLHFFQARVYFEKGLILESLTEFNAAQDYLQFISDTQVKIKFLNASARAFEAGSLYDKAVKIRLELNEILVSINDSVNLARGYGNMAITYQELDFLDKAIDYNTKAGQIFEALNDDVSLAIVSMNLGSNYDTKGEHGTAEKLYFESLEMIDGLGIAMLESAVYDHLGWMYLNAKDYDEAIKYMLLGLEIREQIPNQLALSSSLIGTAKVLLKNKEITEAEKYINRAVKVVALTGDPGMEHDLNLVLRDLYEHKGMFKQAYSKYKEIVEYEESINTESINKAATEFDLKNKYMIRTIEDSLKTVQKINVQKVKNEAVEKEKNYILLVSILVAIFLSVFIVFAIRRYRVEQKQKNVIEEQKILLQNDFENLKEFTENASHEMQTPMAIINSKVESLMQNSNLSEEQMNHIKMIYSSTYRMSKMNRSLLLLSKVENNQFPKNQQIDLSSLLSDILMEFDEMIDHKNLSKEYFIAPNVSKEANEFLCSTIFYNLIKNAITHNIDQGGISISLNNDVLSVENTGLILDENPEQLFKRFKKSGNNPNSTGLGLAIVKKSCIAQGWTVDYIYVSGMHKLEVKF